ncbi:thiol reductant ABC exporter subunit CydD [Ornithinibacillus salinisoli]|uniref:Thiol reductant ABC exporter subunit CydD n=1 Tax=Ornithinibacillus salinisoli TaxID=1848459 RepID=A0ABW4VVW6_9BACI
MKSLKEIASAQKKDMLFLFMVAVVIGTAIVFQAFLLVKAVDGVFLNEQSISQVLPTLGGLFLVLLVRTIGNYWKGKRGIEMATKVKRHLRKELMEKYAKNPLQSSLRGQTGGKVSMMMDAVDEVDNYFSKYIPQVIQTTFIPILILIIVFTQHVNSGLIMLVTAPFIPIFMIVIGMKTKVKSEEQMDQLAAFSGRFLDALQGLTTLKLFGQAKRQKETIENSSLGFRDATMEILKVAFTSSFMLEVVTMLSIGIVALELAIQLIVYQSISFFTAFFVLVLVPEFFSSLKELGTTFHNGRTSMGAAKKVFEELAEEEQLVKWGQMAIDHTEPPEMELQNLAFRYGEDQFSINNINEKITPYSQIAIVGRSGSGKTTLLHLLAGLLAPEEGEILLNGQGLYRYREKDWFDQLGYITQDPFIFSGTIAENISIGGGEHVSREEIEKAAKQAGVDDLVCSLDKGYDTPIGEAGRGLSGGEKQRLAIARAFLKKPSVILFDEPTTGLDLQTEKILQASMKQLAQHATVITVAHRLHTIKHADKILFLEKGRLIASGSHEELMESVPAYKSMVSVQRGGTAS